MLRGKEGLVIEAGQRLGVTLSQLHCACTQEAESKPAEKLKVHLEHPTSSMIILKDITSHSNTLPCIQT